MMHLNRCAPGSATTVRGAKEHGEALTRDYIPAWRVAHTRARLIRLHHGPAKIHAIRRWLDATRDALEVRQ